MDDIVTATVDDADALAEFEARTFVETYEGVREYDARVIGLYTRQAFGADVVRSEVEDPANRHFLSRVGGALAGFAKVTARTPPECVTARPALQLHRLYVAKAFHGRGLGRALLGRALDEARARGCVWLWLTVWEHNPSAVAFYERHGFARVGECEWAFEADGQRYVDTDWVYVVRV
jgi:ribosomal protein S18 acetylase RimI-like enzyme